MMKMTVNRVVVRHLAVPGRQPFLFVGDADGHGHAPSRLLTGRFFPDCANGIVIRGRAAGVRGS